MKTKLLPLIIVAVCIFSVAAQRITANDIIGTWLYRISDVPPEYETGSFIFEEKDGKLIGYSGQSEKQQMKNLVVDQGKVSFSTDFDGGSIKYTLNQKGDTLLGAVSTQYGDFTVTAVKEKK
ncbi:hypothetical protein ACFP1I_07600 [Dyadobacter subterraneus]|uniref:Extracellular endo-alpha-(1->5)-L-arabinanase C-terminal domain-containing protein n=1 Tax=Dyadobacter subterraneus TaxID=2773304 RepID=A0ABR9WES7_9BACT|nr:hypothetical protein [Dyadobacter subterraneus]MBE9464002.1 hypothetical protein [Dyadobacter subterraneus]